MELQNLSRKRVVCITGTVWTGHRAAPRKRLVEAGYCRPTWFTTERAITDASYTHISETQFHIAASKNEVFVHIKYGGGHVGILSAAFDDALNEAKEGVLVVGPPELVAKVADRLPRTVIFTFKCCGNEMSDYLDQAENEHQLHRIDIESERVGAWDRAYDEIFKVLSK
jgi:hypothetical protein